MNPGPRNRIRSRKQAGAASTDSALLWYGSRLATALPVFSGNIPVLSFDRRSAEHALAQKRSFLALPNIPLVRHVDAHALPRIRMDPGSLARQMQGSLCTVSLWQGWPQRSSAPPSLTRAASICPTRPTGRKGYSLEIATEYLPEALLQRLALGQAPVSYGISLHTAGYVSGYPAHRTLRGCDRAPGPGAGETGPARSDDSGLVWCGLCRVHIGRVREHRTAARWPAADNRTCNGSPGRLCRQSHHQAGVLQDRSRGDLGGFGVRPWH